MVEIVRVEPRSVGESALRSLVEAHREATGSEKAAAFLDDWPNALATFWRVRPNTGLSELSPAEPAALPAKG